MGRVSGLEDHRHRESKTPMINFTHGNVRGDKDQSQKEAKDSYKLLSIEALEKKIRHKIDKAEKTHRKISK